MMNHCTRYFASKLPWLCLLFDRPLTFLPQIFDISPANDQLLGQWTIFFLVFNRTVGSGIFTVPFIVIRATQSLGVSLFIWAGCGIVVLCGACTWLELGLSVPRVTIEEDGDQIRVAAPRSGGEKNWVSRWQFCICLF